MATLQVPVRVDLLEYRQQVRLDGELFTFLFKFNSREGFWYYDLFDAAEVPIKHGIKVVTDFPELRTIALASRPDGELLAVDPTGNGVEPDDENFGTAVPLVYIEAADVPTE